RIERVSHDHLRVAEMRRAPEREDRCVTPHRERVRREGGQSWRTAQAAGCVMACLQASGTARSRTPSRTQSCLSGCGCRGLRSCCTVSAARDTSRQDRPVDSVSHRRASARAADYDVLYSSYRRAEGPASTASDAGTSLVTTT